MAEALKCSSCGAPLPFDGAAFARCAYCGVVSRIYSEPGIQQPLTTRDVDIPILLLTPDAKKPSVKKELWKAFVNYARSFDQSVRPLEFEAEELRKQLTPVLPS